MTATPVKPVELDSRSMFTSRKGSSSRPVKMVWGEENNLRFEGVLATLGVVDVVDKLAKRAL